MGRIQVLAFRCERCGHVWLPKNVDKKLDNLGANLPNVCPKCKSPYWNKPRKTTTTTGT